MEITQYLKRIQYDGPLHPTLPVLQNLQLQHMLHVPFENLDIHLGRPIELDVAGFYRKVIKENRGGFCYELNGLFYALLSQIGFQVKMISARVHNTQKDAFGPEFDHMALIVTIDEQEYLSDVGFGKFAIRPLQFETGLIQDDGRERYRIESFDDTHFLISKWNGDNWHPEYLFSPQPRQLNDFSEMCRHQQTSPDSHFTKKRVCSLLTPNGRITLSDLKLLTTIGRETTETILADEFAFNRILRDQFDMNLANS